MGFALAVLGLFASSGLETGAAQGPALVPDLATRLPESGWTRRTYTLRSDVLGEELHLHVALPPSWGRAERTYPTLYLLDGQYYARGAQDVVTALCANGQIPELVLVGIESRDRRVDFTPSEIYLEDVRDRARAGSYLDFLERELVPAAEATLHAGRPRVLRCLGGRLPRARAARDRRALRALSPLYGAPLVPPEPLMRRVVGDFRLEGRGRRAGEWLERYVVSYGEPDDLAELEAQVAEVTAQGEPTETVAGLLALPRAAAGDASAPRDVARQLLDERRTARGSERALLARSRSSARLSDGATGSGGPSGSKLPVGARPVMRARSRSLARSRMASSRAR